MRICLIAPVPPFRGGIAKYCYSLAQELEKRHELLLLSYSRQYPKILYGSKKQIDPHVDRNKILKEFLRLSYDIDSLNPASWRRAAIKIAAFKADTVVFPWWVVYWTPMYLYLLHSLRKEDIKIVFLCINVFEHEDNPVKKFLTKLTLGRVTSLIVHSDQEKSELLAFNPAATVTKHLLPLFTYNAHPVDSHGADLHLLFFGFVRQYKGLDILLKAISTLRNRDILLKIVGEFWDGKDEYLKLIRDLDISGNVELIDRYVPDNEMSDYFAWTDVVVLPYRRTKTSGIIATAYGYGKPVLVTNVGGFHEVVSNGSTGKIVEPENPEALAEGIEWFLTNRQADFAGNIRKFASQRMSWSSLVDTLENQAEG